MYLTRNKFLVSASFLTMLVLLAAALYSFSYGASDEPALNCDKIIAEVESGAIDDPLYEPPKAYFDCINPT